MARPRNFDEDQALDQAMRLFWRHGYEGTSLNDLTEAMGINRPSLYATFGNKEALFARAVERYVEGPGAAITTALAAPTAYEAIALVLRRYADAAGEPDRPAGCFLVNGALSCSAAGESAKATLSTQRNAAFDALRLRFVRAQREGELPPDTNPAQLARYFWSVLIGMAVQATDGVTRGQLRQIAALALQTWPAPRTARA